MELVTLAVVVSIYGTLGSTFESLVISILIIIYATVALDTSYSAVRFASSVGTADEQFLELRKLLGKSPSVADVEASRLLPETMKRYQGAAWIHQFALWVVDLIALWRLVKALGWF